MTHGYTDEHWLDFEVSTYGLCSVCSRDIPLRLDGEAVAHVRVFRNLATRACFAKPCDGGQRVDVDRLGIPYAVDDADAADRAAAQRANFEHMLDSLVVTYPETVTRECALAGCFTAGCEGDHRFKILDAQERVAIGLEPTVLADGTRVHLDAGWVPELVR